jgi:hypothetical protein
VLFLTALCDALDAFGTVSAGLFQGDVRKPVLLIDCGNVQRSLQVRCVLSFHSHTQIIDQVRVLPLHLSPKLRTVPVTSCAGLSIAEDARFVAHLEWCHASIRACPALADAIVLAKVVMRCLVAVASRAAN